MDAKAVVGNDDSVIRAALMRVIEPISGSVQISRYETITDPKGHIVAYKAWVQRE